MSSNLAYEPIRPKKYQTLGYDLRQILQEKYSLMDGAKTLKSSDVDYLKGLFDAGIKDAQKLIDAIEKYSEVSTFLIN